MSEQAPAHVHDPVECGCELSWDDVPAEVLRAAVRAHRCPADPHAYESTAAPGIRKLGLAYEVVGANGRRILVHAAPEGVWLGSVLLAGPGVLLNLADVLRGVAADDSGRGGR